METFKIAVSRYCLDQKIPQGSDLWPRFNASFDNYELDAGYIMRAVYQGRAITTWHKCNWRTSENFLCGQHIGLDFDNGDKTSSLPQLVQDKFIAKYAAFVYTTISHTEDCPRARAIFTLDIPIMQAKNYTLATASLLWLFGTADRQCKDAVRFFYGVSGCKFEYFGNVLPLDVVKKLIANYQETDQQEKRKTSNKDYHTPASQQEVAETLHCIDP